VRLLNYPVVVSDAPSRGYVGHSAHVTGVRFSAATTADTLLDSGGHDAAMCWAASCGGGDRAVFQFKLVEIRKVEAPVIAEPEPVWGPLDKQGKVFGWTKQSVGCTTSHENGDTKGGQQAPHDTCKGAEGDHVQEVKPDGGGSSDDDGGWGNM
jgi:echinoderm microtubule-associated protein-like 6